MPPIGFWPGTVPRSFPFPGPFILITPPFRAKRA